MTTITPADQVNLLTRLPAPAGNPPQLPTGTVALFKDCNWSSQRLDIVIDDYPMNKRHTVPRSMYDEASQGAFNLPVGTVVTLTDDVRSIPAGKTPADLSGCGRCIDLVGTGKTEAVDITGLGMNDCVSTFFWRTVDLNLGAIELFEHNDFHGIRSTIFLSEWEPGTAHSITDWWLQDRISSVRWKSVRDRQTATLFEHGDGTGGEYNNITGWSSIREVANLDDFRINDQVSAFRWDTKNPIKEIIAPFPIVASVGAGSSGLTKTMSGTNSSSLSNPVTVTLKDETTQTVTIETTDTHVAGISSTWSLEATAGVEGIASSKTSWSVSLQYSYTRSDRKETSHTKTVALEISQVVNAPPNSSWTATLLVNIGKIPPTVYNTTAERWYDAPVTGGVRDGNLYKRTEPVIITMAGSLAGNTRIDIKSTPL